eukprot:Phypoly_transcript_05928.p1 GENE.Phypoly_transcript_05928~~Phypoly_transcript_05928.p1  ORF type:complete len:545 (+),score=60.63 Phypoly_transcript_05928:205-1839(+)
MDIAMEYHPADLAAVTINTPDSSPSHSSKSYDTGPTTPAYSAPVSPASSSPPPDYEANLPPASSPKGPPGLSMLREIAFVGTVCSANLLTQSGLAQALAPLYYIGNTLHLTDLGKLSWFLAAYSLTVGTFILIAGRLGDMYGHKRVFIIGYVWYGLWSLITGFSAYSHSEIFYDICRAFQGIGPAFMMPNALAILGRVYGNGTRKDMVFAVFGATAPNGFLVGALFSALFAQLAWWPWAYWAMAIACFVISVISHYVIPPVDEEIRNREGPKLKFDYWGAITGVLGLVLFNFAWNQGPVSGWDKPYNYILLILGVIFFVIFLYVEHKVEQPLLPPRIFNLEVGFVLVCIALGWASFGIWLFYIWQLLVVLRGLSPLHAVAQFVPVGFSGAAAAITTGKLLSRLPTSVIMTISMVAFTAGSILLATVPERQTYWAQTFVALVVTPWGMDMSFPSATIILSNHMPREDQGIAASLVNTVVNYSISIGLGIAGTVVVYATKGSGTSDHDMLKGFRDAWYTGIAFAGTGIFVALLSVYKTRSESKSKA